MFLEETPPRKYEPDTRRRRKERRRTQPHHDPPFQNILSTAPSILSYQLYLTNGSFRHTKIGLLTVLRLHNTAALTRYQRQTLMTFWTWVREHKTNGVLICCRRPFVQIRQPVLNFPSRYDTVPGTTLTLTLDRWFPCPYGGRSSINECLCLI